jgi:tetratricopeptide (TPR) repeat protein/predicted Ser/Thr protein kinase
MNDSPDRGRPVRGTGSGDGAAQSGVEPSIARYELFELIGEGTTGKVYRAIDLRLQRAVALKILSTTDPVEAERLVGEARAQARIDHEHVCRVFETGELEGRPFVAMQLIRGPTLDELAPSLELEARIEILEQVARAIAAAHVARVTHRDLRPGNVMVERRDGGKWHAYVLDFGAADGADSDPDEMSGASPGALAFLAPEQAAGDPRSVGRRTDVYAIGATLYAVVAGQRPFFGRTRAETRRQIVEDEPLPLGMVAPDAPVDLETIAHLAMAKRPGRRYPSARALADDLRRWLDGEPIRATPAGPLVRMTAWLRLRQTTALLVSLAVLLAVVAVGSVLRQRIREVRRQALVERYDLEVERVEELLRRSRMMPLHDTRAAERKARNHLAEIEVSLLEDGALARGPAYSALGRGYLMLRQYPAAEGWLRAAVDVGFDGPTTESALGRTMASRAMEARLAGRDVSAGEVEEAIRYLRRRGPETQVLDRYLDALMLFLEGRIDEALDAASSSMDAEPWLYEARQLEGDLMILRSATERVDGNLDAAVADLHRAGEVYREALETARSDAWLWERECSRAIELLRVADSGIEDQAALVERGLEAARSAAIARPSWPAPLLLEAEVHVLAAGLAGGRGDESVADLEQARVAISRAEALDPDNAEVKGLRTRIERARQNSAGGTPD